MTALRRVGGRARGEEREWVSKTATAASAAARMRQPPSAVDALHMTLGNRVAGRIAALSQAERAARSNTTGIPESVRAKMETAFGTDLSDVRVHTSSARAQELGASAFTQGNEVHLAPGQWAPGTRQGQAILGHELWHVVQQREGRVRTSEQFKGFGLNNDHGLEAEADRMGDLAAAGNVAPQAHAARAAQHHTLPIQMKKGWKKRRLEMLQTILQLAGQKEHDRIEKRLNDEPDGGQQVCESISLKGTDDAPASKPDRDKRRARMLLKRYRALPADFDERTKIRTHYRAGPLYGGTKPLSVDTDLDPYPEQAHLEGIAGQHSHNNYFSPMAWTIGDVFKPESAPYFLNEAIWRQYELARAHAQRNAGGPQVSAQPAHINIHHVVNKQTRAWLDERFIVKRLSPAETAFDVDAGLFMAETVFGKTMKQILNDIEKANGVKARVTKMTWEVPSANIYTDIVYT